MKFWFKIVDIFIHWWSGICKAHTKYADDYRLFSDNFSRSSPDSLLVRQLLWLDVTNRPPQARKQATVLWQLCNSQCYKVKCHRIYYLEINLNELGRLLITRAVTVMLMEVNFYQQFCFSAHFDTVVTHARKSFYTLMSLIKKGNSIFAGQLTDSGRLRMRITIFKIDHYHRLYAAKIYEICHISTWFVWDV